MQCVLSGPGCGQRFPWGGDGAAPVPWRHRVRWAVSAVPAVPQLGRGTLCNGTLTVCLPVRGAFPAALCWFATEGPRWGFCSSPVRVPVATSSGELPRPVPPSGAEPARWDTGGSTPAALPGALQWCPGHGAAMKPEEALNGSTAWFLHGRWPHVPR